MSTVEEAGDMSVGSERPNVPANVVEAMIPLSALESVEDEASIFAGKVMRRV